ncbi:hypothetical protein MPTK1_5g19862 [Marchantia polymorpha subsp. ruderalis]|uniref:Uncharacterized protein n=3 Tax=Marchantia polymorpha TaxID=3197 RepID=A0A176VHM5_MARPO|nr:hypothetical protein AXG93_4905s1390 [Marchantia polymorpha subsp. ruderalis]PTQ29834.1 hypothetical protein MARPO_0134s0042 [Marchantia polymorpha]BBN20693.1 hypothetical protein Mp_zg00240 [Marchantia polymorpha subsp. ruderalis]|eukprot:PTQ29834.1 hypothetical protein MARPO_0134s0042 [Marchantia polymorpha]
MAYGTFVFAILSLLASSVVATDYCVYTLYVKTGFLPKAGTDSRISTRFFDVTGTSSQISNISEWGGSLMGPNHNYFERNSLDVFTGLGECLKTSVCGLEISSDGSGDHHGWYNDYVEVSVTSSKPGLSCNTHRFTVQKWLATDVYPYQLSMVIDDCDYSLQHQ